MTFSYKTLALSALIPAFLATEEPALLCESYTPGLICLCDGWGVSLFAEGLYWVVREHHLIYATSDVGLEETSLLPPASGRHNFRGELQRITPSWDWGWRAGLSYTSPCDYWDLIATWTSFSTNKSNEIDLIDLPALNLWGYPDNPQAARLFAGRGEWNLKYDVFDTEFGRAFWIGRCLAFRPHFGIRSAWIDQGLAFLSEFQPDNGIPFGSDLHLKCDFSGTGLRSGFDLHFTSGTGFGLYGKISISLLYGKFETTFSETETFANFDSQKIAESIDDFHMGVTGFQGILGINWKRSFCCNRYLFGLYAGWEFNQWSDLDKFLHFQGQLGEGIFHQEQSSLSLMGLSFGGRFDF